MNSGRGAIATIPRASWANKVRSNDFSGRTTVTASGYTASYLEEVVEIVRRLDRPQIDSIVRIIAGVRAGKGGLFFLGVGGSAGNCSHAVNDFRKIAGVEAYAPTDNVSELTARINDDGWESVFANWLLGSRLGPKDCVFVFSVGGGNLSANVSPNLVGGLELARRV